MKHAHNRREIIITSAVLAVVFVYVVISETKVYPAMERANTYVANVEPLIVELKRSVSELSESTESPLFNSPDLMPGQKLIAISRTEGLITRVNNQLNQVEKYDTNLGSLELAEPLGLTKRASEIREQLPYSISQTREVVKAYAGMITYIKQRQALDVHLSAQLQEFNSIENFDVLVGQSEAWATKKSEIDSLLAQLRSLIVPAGFETVHAEAVTTYTRASNNFEQLATILLAPSELALDIIARDIEATTKQHENINANSFFNAFDKSPTVSDIAQLADKFERY